jgi:hypothetical protein
VNEHATLAELIGTTRLMGVASLADAMACQRRLDARRTA